MEPILLCLIKTTVACARIHTRFDAEQSVVFRNSFAATGSARFYIGSVCADGDVCNRCVLCLSGTVREDIRITVVSCKVDDLHHLGKRSDLIRLYEYRICDAVTYTVVESSGVCYE